MARKPLDGTVAENYRRHGTGGLRIDECRIGTTVETWPISRNYGPGKMHPGGRGETQQTGPAPPGRWPANVVLDEDAARMLDEEVGDCGVSQGGRIGKKMAGVVDGAPAGRYEAGDPGYGDSGGPSRFFYTAKASRSEREEGLEGIEPQRRTDGREKDIENPRLRTSQRRNVHPTVKPLDLMRWLVRLVTPEGGLVLDPFAGSGTTGVACYHERLRFIGIEREHEYAMLAEARIVEASRQGYMTFEAAP